MASQNIFRIAEESESSDHLISSEEQPEEKPVIIKKRGRPPIDPSLLKTNKDDYYRNFYHEKRKALVTCPNCGELVTKNQKSKHIHSNKCKTRTEYINGLKNMQ